MILGVLKILSLHFDTFVIYALGAMGGNGKAFPDTKLSPPHHVVQHLSLHIPMVPYQKEGQYLLQIFHILAGLRISTPDSAILVCSLYPPRQIAAASLLEHIFGQVC